MKNEKYQTIYKDLNRVWDYIDDLQTLLDWLKDNNILTDEQHCFIKFDDDILTDEQHRFVTFDNDCYTWWCDGKSIQLSPGEAFALQRLGFIFEEATSNSKVKTCNDEPEFIEVKEEINNEND